MTGKRLDPEAAALWQRVAETVRPLRGKRLKSSPVRGRGAGEGNSAPVEPVAPAAHVTPSPRPSTARGSRGPGDTLDGGWDRRLRRGAVAPDITIDLHGHTLATAHARLEAALDQAVAMQARLILLVTGRPPTDRTERRDGRPVRGAIRASVGDWLQHSRFASHIAAVRSAHPRHGGAGALYLVLRRKR